MNKLKLIKDNDTYRLMFSSLEVFRHSIDKPFITVSRGNLEFRDKRGTFKVTQNVLNEEGLSNLIVIEDKENLKLQFSSKDIKVFVNCLHNEQLLEMTLESIGKFDKITFNFSASEDEGIFGLGEQFRRLNHKGQLVENMVSEHISLMPIIKKSFAPFKWFKYKPREKIKTYSPMSTFMSSRHYAIRVDVDSYGVEDYEGDTNRLSYWQLPKSIKYVIGETYKDISKGLSIAKPYLPDWVSEGMIIGVQGGIDYAEKQAFKMLDKGAKISGVWCQDWSGKKITVAGKQVYWNWEVSNEMYPNLKERISKLNEKGVHFLGYINPYLIEDSPMFNYCKEKGYLIRNSAGEVYLFKTTTFPAGMMDLTNPHMASYLKNTIIRKNMIDIGISGWMADFGEYLPSGVVLHSGESSADLHNIWTTLWAKLNREAIEEAGKTDEIFFFTRSGYNGAEKYSPIMWNGDQHTDYSVDYGMPCTIPASINIGLSGMPLIHSDIGGYITFKSLKRDAELFIRWMSMNTFTPMMRSHETTRPLENAQYDSKDVLQYSILYSNIHKLLSPYIKSVISEAKEGIPAIRAPFYNYNDYKLYNEDYVYMFGNDLFIAPVINKGDKEREFLLPDDEWKHLFTGETYKGGRMKISAPLNCPPVFYRLKSEFISLFEEITEFIKK